MYCPRCGAQNDDGSRTCRQCGYPLMPPTSDSQDMPQSPRSTYAGFWKRLAALIIDSIILNIAMTVVGYAIGSPLLSSLRGGGEGLPPARTAVYSLVGLVVGWLYYTLLESSSSQATVGKMALGIVVTDLDGRRVSFGRANIRYWSKIVSALILFIGYLMAAFTERKQALHDLLAGTLVVNKWPR